MTSEFNIRERIEIHSEELSRLANRIRDIQATQYEIMARLIRVELGEVLADEEQKPPAEWQFGEWNVYLPEEPDTRPLDMSAMVQIRCQNGVRDFGEADCFIWGEKGTGTIVGWRYAWREE